jgi:hypothetical protein
MSPANYYCFNRSELYLQIPHFPPALAQCLQYLVSAQRIPSCETFLRTAKLPHDQTYKEGMDEVAKTDPRACAKRADGNGILP